MPARSLLFVCLDFFFKEEWDWQRPRAQRQHLSCQKDPPHSEFQQASPSYLLYLQWPAILIPLHHSSGWLCIHRTADIAMDSHGHINDRGHVEDTGWVCDRGGVGETIKAEGERQRTLPIPLQKNLYIYYFRLSTFNTGLGARATNNPTPEHL